MPSLPPLRDVLDILQSCVLPGAGGAALLMALFLLFGRRAAAIGSAAAVAFAFFWGNFSLDSTGSDPPSWQNTSRLLPWLPGETAPGYQWLPRAALVLVLVGFASRWLGLAAEYIMPMRFRWCAGAIVWMPRILAITVVSGWLVVGKAAEAPEWAWLRWQLAVIMLLLWLVLDGMTRIELSAEVYSYLAVVFFTGGVVLLYSHNARFMELAVLFGSANLGIAIAAAGARAADGAKPLCWGAIPASVAFLPGLLLGTRPSHADHLVPAACFWLIALAPLTLTPFLIPRMRGQNRWMMLAVRLLLILLPVVIAVALAGQHEKFPYEDAPEW